MTLLDDANLATLAARVAVRAIHTRTAICSAESCTGGLVAYLLTDTPGVSAVFQGSIVAYANRAKTELLGVEQRVLDLYGAVSEEVALAMARGACERLHAEVGVATTGIAGPGGGTVEKPVGLVYVAASGRGIDTCRRFEFGGDRTENVRAAAFEALRLLAEALPIVRS